MKQQVVSLVVLALQGAHAIPVTSQEPSPPLLVSLPLRHVQAPSLRRRDLPEQGVINNDNLYLAEVGIGNPPQKVSLAVDTGSPSTWVNPDCRSAGFSNMNQCTSLGKYTPSSSSPPPSKLAALDRIITYGDGSTSTMVGYSDTFTWGNSVKIPNTPFAIAARTSGMYVGIMGLSPDAGDGWDKGYTNYTIVSAMANQGAIASRTFAMGFKLTGGSRGVKNVQAGTLVFGGLDKNSFSGDFFKIPILPKDQAPNGWRYWIQTSEIKNNRPDGKTGITIPTTGTGSKFLLDSGTTATYLARDVYDKLLADMPLGGLAAGGLPLFPCNMNGSLEFKFGNGSIRAPYSAFTLPLTDGYCQLALLPVGASAADPSGVPFSILGLGFLRAAYAVFDWDNREVHLAQGANCGTPDLVAITGGPKGFPDVKGNCK